MTATKKQYLVDNDLISVRLSTNPNSPDFERFVHWQRGEVMSDWPKHTDITGLIEGGHIREVKSDVES